MRILWLGIIAVSINVLASLVIRKDKPRTNPFSACIFWKILWAGGCHPNIVLRFTDWYILDPLLTLILLFPSLFCQKLFHVLSTLKIFLDAVPEGVDIQQVKSDLGAVGACG